MKKQTTRSKARPKAKSRTTKPAKTAPVLDAPPVAPDFGFTNNPLASDDAPVVQSTATHEPDPPVPQKGVPHMANATLRFKGLSKSGKFALYAGLRTVTRMSITDFPNSAPPESLAISGELAGPREKKPPMTAEERKAWRANRPKLTLEQQIAKEEARLAKKKAKLAAQEAVPA